MHTGWAVKDAAEEVAVSAAGAGPLAKTHAAADRSHRATSFGKYWKLLTSDAHKLLLELPDGIIRKGGNG